MHNTEQTLTTAIAELRCLRPDHMATLDELTALRVSAECIDQLMRTCVTELRTEGGLGWNDIAYALDTTTSVVKRRYGALPEDASEDTELVGDFWEEHADRFQWAFLPVDFVHAIYQSWLKRHRPDMAPMTQPAFTRRVKALLVQDEHWLYTRARPGVLLVAHEPLLDSYVSWSRPVTNKAIWGFRRH